MRLISTFLRFTLLSVLLATPVWVTTVWAHEQPAQVVFVCEHGNVKSLIASTLFNQTAQKHGLSVRSISRGINPEPDVPAKIADELRKDGTDVSQFKPEALTQNDVSGAQRVIAIGVDLNRFKTDESGMIESWTDIPPASIDYAASRDALLRHIDILLVELQANRVK